MTASVVLDTKRFDARFDARIGAVDAVLEALGYIVLYAKVVD